MADNEPLEKSEEPARVTVSVRMPVALANELNSVAEQQKTDKSKLIIQAVAERLGMTHLLNPWGTDK